MRLAELLQTCDRGARRGGNRQQSRNDSHRSDVREMRCASRARLPRRSPADRPSLLHQLGVAEVRASEVARIWHPTKSLYEGAARSSPAVRAASAWRPRNASPRSACAYVSLIATL